jgi:hypothetical protein
VLAAAFEVESLCGASMARLLFWLCSTVLWCAVALSPPPGLSRFTTQLSDLHSHVMATVLALERGPAIYARPIRELCPIRDTPELRAFAEAQAVNPKDVCTTESREGRRPLAINWPDFPRPYPPGAQLLFLPQAILYDALGMPLLAIRALSYCELVVFAHVVALLLWALLSPRGRGRSLPLRLRVAPLVAIVFFEVLTWSLGGMYDAVPLAFLLASALCLSRERPRLALLAYAAALFFHYRAVWFLPMGALAALETWRTRKERPRAAFAFLGASAGLAALSLGSFAAVAPALAHLPISNYAHLPMPSRTTAQWLGAYALPALALVGQAVLGRDWKLAGALAWLLLVVTLARQGQLWHGLMAVPLFGVAALEGGRARHVALALCGWLLVTVSIAQRVPLPDALLSLLSS